MEINNELMHWHGDRIAEAEQKSNYKSALVATVIVALVGLGILFRY